MGDTDETEMNKRMRHQTNQLGMKLRELVDQDSAFRPLPDAKTVKKQKLAKLGLK